MSIRSRLLILSAMFGGLGVAPLSEEVEPAQKTTKKKMAPRKPSVQFIREQNTRRGLTEFDIEGRTIWALNRKNAVRKALNEIRKESV